MKRFCASNKGAEPFLKTALSSRTDADAMIPHIKTPIESARQDLLYVVADRHIGLRI
jgi:hypothetical protein